MKKSTASTATISTSETASAKMSRRLWTVADAESEGL